MHAGYAKWRRLLLAAGVKLSELRRSWPPDVGPKQAGPLGSSASSLHAKTFAVNGARVFVGSFNFDPRSARLNTETGLIIDSPAILDGSVADRAYKVRLAPDGALYWIERKQGAAIRYDTEPGAGFWRRMDVLVLSWLPIDWLL